MSDYITRLAAVAAALFLGAVLIGAAWHKLRDPDAFARTLDDYALLPRVLLRPVSMILPALEAGIGIALLVPSARAPGALAAAGLLFIYMLAMGINLGRGRRDLDCGCTFHGSGHALGARDLFRNAVLIGLCLFAAVNAHTLPALWIDRLTVAGAAAGMFLVYLAAEQLQVNALRLRLLRTGHD